MSETTSQGFLSLVTPRQGHFRLESGHHSQLWLDLDGLFVDPARVAPLVSALAQNLRGRGVAAVCGPLMGGAFLAQMLSATLDVEFAFTERVMPAGREGLYRAEYRLPRGLRDRVRGKRVAIVDDVVSAGSAVRGTHVELTAHGAFPGVVGALLELGSLTATFFAQHGIPVVSVAQLPYEIWLPGACPLCVSGLPLEDMAIGVAPQEVANLDRRDAGGSMTGEGGDRRPLSIRPPLPDDIDALAALLGQLGYPTSPAAVGTRLAELARDTRVAVFVADGGHGPAGLATAYVTPVVHADRPVAVLSALVVDERHRRRGVGRRLVEAAQAWARDRRAYRMTVSTGLARADAHAFYERLGYEHTSRRYSKLL